MHDFEMHTGFDSMTVMFCKQCGLSYVLARYKTVPSRTVWEVMTFADYQDNAIAPPASPCHAGQEREAKKGQ